MNHDVGKELAALARLGAADLRHRYAEVFGEPTRTGNKAWLVKRIAWRLQMLAQGDLSERARQRAAELANDADLRLSPPRLPQTAAQPTLPGRTSGRRCPRTERLPPPGTILHRPCKGQTVQVQILEHGFAYAGKVYPSLSAVAQAITGSHCNGYLFFHLTSQGAAS
jgi:hypothetical protein